MSCKACDQAKKAVKNLASGAIHLPQVLGPTAAPDVIQERRETCNQCDDRTEVAGQAVCKRCWCYLPAKRRIRAKSCEVWTR